MSPEQRELDKDDINVERTFYNEEWGYKREDDGKPLPSGCTRMYNYKSQGVEGRNEVASSENAHDGKVKKAAETASARLKM